MTDLFFYLLLMLLGKPADTQGRGERVINSPDTLERKTGIRPHGTIHPFERVRRHLGGRGGRP